MKSALAAPPPMIAPALPQLDLRAGRDAWAAYFEDGWQWTDRLFSALVDDDAFYSRAYHKLRHPLVFYYAHPASLYVNKLRVAGLFDGPVNAAFEQLFETGVDEMRWDDLHEGENPWPAMSEVRAYREAVRQRIHQLIATHPDLAEGHAPISMDHPLWALAMGFEHERIHLETSSVLMREIAAEHFRTPADWPASLSQTDISSPTPREGIDFPANPFIPVGATAVALGKPRDYPSFGWDNEYGHETRDVADFSASAMLISNGEFYAFVRSGAYEDAQFWSADGWAWRNFRNTKCPSFWVSDGPTGLHRYKLRSLFAIIPMQWNWPALVNHHEATAYANWVSARDGIPTRLITEAEHHALRDGAPRGNLNLTSGSESPVDAFPANARGFHDVFGNAWQWCADDFHPLDGFTIHPYYTDFSTPCYDGQHNIILGGSFISVGDEASPFARFHFRPHFFQHAGFRLARGDNEPRRLSAASKGSAHYETDTMLQRYLHMHYATAEEFSGRRDGPSLPMPADAVCLPIACHDLVTQFATQHTRALDLGCAVGRSTFELAREFDSVLGIDYSAEFITAAQTLQRTGQHPYRRFEHGEVTTPLTARIAPDIDRSRVRFQQGDACHLPPNLPAFDAVLMANVLCRLPDPAACLNRMGELVAPGGVLVMTTPFSWLADYTPPDRWIDGIAGCAEILKDFKLIHEAELPFMIRDHARKYEYIVTLASVWRRHK